MTIVSALRMAWDQKKTSMLSGMLVLDFIKVFRLDGPLLHGNSLVCLALDALAQTIAPFQVPQHHLCEDMHRLAVRCPLQLLLARHQMFKHVLQKQHIGISLAHFPPLHLL